MERTWKPTTAGILCIVAGISGLIVAVGMIIAFTIIGFSNVPGMDAVPDFVLVILSGFGIPLGLLSILSLMGGIYTLNRKKWGLALAGSISAIFASIPLLGGLPVGITATVLTTISKQEFEQ